MNLEPIEIYDSVIVGAGLSGLTAAYDLAASGARILVLEALDYVGGRVRTIHYGQLYAEAGGMIVTDEDTAILELLKELSLELSPPWGLHGSDMFVVDRFVKQNALDPDEIASIGDKDSLKPEDAGLREAYARVMRDIQTQSASIDFPYQTDLRPEWDSQTFAEFLDSYHPGLRTHFDLQLAATAGESVDKISLFWGLVTTQWNLDNNFYTIQGGTGKIADALFGRIGEHAKVGAQVLRVAENDGGKVTVAYRQDGVDLEIEARSVVMAVPPKAVLDTVQGLSEQKKAALKKVRFGSYIPVHLRFAERFWTDRIESGYLNCHGVVFADIVDATRDQEGEGGILICFIAGPPAGDLANESEERILELVLRDLDKVFPGRSDEVIESKVFAWPDAIPYLTTNYAPLFEALRRPQGNIHFCGDYTQGAGLTEAVYSGRLAARTIIERSSPAG